MYLIRKNFWPFNGYNLFQVSAIILHDEWTGRRQKHRTQRKSVSEMILFDCLFVSMLVNHFFEINLSAAVVDDDAVVIR